MRIQSILPIESHLKLICNKCRTVQEHPESLQTHLYWSLWWPNSTQNIFWQLSVEAQGRGPSWAVKYVKNQNHPPCYTMNSEYICQHVRTWILSQTYLQQMKNNSRASRNFRNKPVLLAPQSGAPRISAYRDFLPIPSHPTYSFRSFKPFYGDLKQPKQTKEDQCRPVSRSTPLVFHFLPTADLNNALLV